MIYLIDTMNRFNGGCIPVLHSFKDLAGNEKFPTNISITNHQGKLISNIRLTDYTYIPVGTPNVIHYISHSTDTCTCTCSCNAIFEVNNDIHPLVYETNGDTGFKLNQVSFKGLEDIRLIHWNDKLYGIGFRPDIIEGQVIPQLIEYNDDLTINRSWVINTHKNMEKNWQPIEDIPFTFMYDPDRSETITLNINELKEADNNTKPTIINELNPPDFSFNLCGSSQLIKYRDGYISLCHTSHRWRSTDEKIHWQYNHYFVRYDKDLNKIWVSQPFKFVNECMEFCCGMTILNDTVYISFSMYDGINHILSYSMEGFNRLLETLENNPDELNGNPAIPYLHDCYNVDKFQSINPICEIVYLFALEQVHVLDNPDRILHVLKKINLPRRIIDAMILYFCVRRSDNQLLLNELKKI